MLPLYSLLNWLYPAISCTNISCPNDYDIGQLVQVLRTLLRSGREDGFFLAIQCLNEDRLSLCLAINAQPKWLNAFPQAARKPTEICKMALAHIQAASIQQNLASLRTKDKLDLRKRLALCTECCLPAIIWASTCNIQNYRDIVSYNTPQTMAKLLYCYALTFMPDKSELLLASGISQFIQVLSPTQSLMGLPASNSLTKTLIRDIKARHHVLKLAESRSCDLGL